MSEASAHSNVPVTTRKGSGIGKGTPGPGRPRGAVNRKTQRRIDAAARILESGTTPLDILWAMARGKRKFNKAVFDCCVAAAPYVHPKLMAVQIDADVRMTHEQALEELDGVDDVLGTDHTKPLGAPIAVIDVATLEALDRELDER